MAARDERGRTLLHVAATRGDAALCAELTAADPEIVNTADAFKNTPLMDAALHGRSLVVKELLRSAAEVVSRNADCMSVLHLSVVNEGAGNGEVVEELVRAAADPDAMCWQTSPLMVAAESGHLWALRVLLDLGADPWRRNAASFTALDYARDHETAQLLLDVMQGDCLSNEPARWARPFKDAGARRAHLHRGCRQVTLEDAFATLEVPFEWLPAFRDTGEYFGEIRKIWRSVILQRHPDKQPELEEEEAAVWTAKFQDAIAAFETIEKHMPAHNI